jgi:hypothetical protein
MEGPFLHRFSENFRLAACVVELRFWISGFRQSCGPKIRQEKSLQKPGIAPESPADLILARCKGFFNRVKNYECLL